MIRPLQEASSYEAYDTFFWVLIDGVSNNVVCENVHAKVRTQKLKL